MIPPKHEPLYTEMARRHLDEMDAAETSYETSHAALSAVLAIISALPDNGPFEVLCSLLAHITISQPEPATALNIILEGVQVGWNTIANAAQPPKVTVQ